MKKIFILSTILFSFLLVSCDSMFRPKGISDVSSEVMWTVPDMAQGVLMNVYNDISNNPDHYDGNFLDVATDNAVTSSYSTDTYRLSVGTLSSTNNPLGIWSRAYNNLQYVHLFLENGLTDATRYAPGSVEDDAATKLRLKGEAYYLRAWWSAELLRVYGGRTSDGRALGYPIVTSSLTPGKAGDFTWQRRNTYEECVEQICSDCDAAAELLPAEATGAYIGRATSRMAEFLKARVLFDAANPAYQPSEIVTINGMGDYTVNDEAGYKDKWLRAALQCQKVLDLCGNPAYVAMLRKDIVDIDQNNPVTPSHFIFRYYMQNKAMENRHFPPYYYGQCLTAPSQNLMDAYPMKSNGYPIGVAGSGYDPQNPYADRDDRLEFTVYHHGSLFPGDTTRFNTIDIVEGGKDAQSFMNGGSRGSRTGYYLHKFMSETVNMLDPVQSVTALHFIPTMRLAEIFLDLAEATNELFGPTETGEGLSRSAYDILKEIRAKSGGIADDQYIELVKESKEAFTQLILNERRLEFAFENFRYWDLRRRLLPLDEGIRGVVATRDSEGHVSYEYVDVEDRKFDHVRYYYVPLPYAECTKNPNLVNNMDY